MSALGEVAKQKDNYYRIQSCGLDAVAKSIRVDGSLGGVLRVLNTVELFTRSFRDKVNIVFKEEGL